MTLRFPLQVRHSKSFEAILAEWERSASTGRGDDCVASCQRIKELRRLESHFPRKPFLGRNVPKGLIPRKYAAQGVTNLFRNDLPAGWRLLHTVIEVEGIQAVIVLDSMDHRNYERLFKYAKS